MRAYHAMMLAIWSAILSPLIALLVSNPTLYLADPFFLAWNLVLIIGAIYYSFVPDNDDWSTDNWTQPP